MNDLNDRLATLADEMTDVDYTALRSRVDTTARRLGRRRAIATSVVALAVAGVAAVGAVQLLPRAEQAPQPAGPSTATVRPTPADPSPARTGPTAAPPPPTATAAAPDHVPGRLVYLRVGGEIEVVTVTDGVARTTSFGFREQGDQVATVAPDGSKVVLIRPAKDASEYPGDLVLVKPGGKRTVLRENVSWGGGTGPAWLPDSRRLLIGVTTLDGDTAVDQSYGYLDTVSGDFDRLDVDSFPDYLAWSANGAYRVHADGDTLVVARANGTVVRRLNLAGQPECDRECPIAVQAVSDDGRYVATAQGGTNPTRVKRATIVLDTVTGKRTALSLKGVNEIFFRPDNSLVVQTADRLHLVSRTGTVTASFHRPDATNEADLMVYRP